MPESRENMADNGSAFWKKSVTPKGQSGLRALNERRILTLIRQHGELPKARIAQETGLSAQAATVIINKLEEDGLVARGEPQRGKRGQPTVPFSLKANGAFGIGIKIGRRSIQITLINFCGQVIASLREQWAYPEVDTMCRFTEKGLRAIMSTLSDDERQSISGIGVAMPFEIWRWSEQAGAPETALARWQEFDVLAAVQAFTSLPVYLCNDDTAACAAELWFGQHRQLNDYLYCFIGTFIGGGLVLNRQLRVGRNGNAGAVGSLPVFMNSQHGQLLETASIHLLEKQLKNEGIETDFLHGKQLVWPQDVPGLNSWLDMVAEGIVHAAVSAHAFLDLDGVVIEGALPSQIKQQLLTKCKQKLLQADFRGLSALEVLAGTVGAEAQSLGSANLPLLAQYSL